MSYQVLARKWRPKNFEQLMGQEHVVTVLVNALKQQRLHHAYLFTGTRGVGKTTIARIFAKSLNCEIGITATPCGKCDVCLDIDQGRFIDLLEIDAASRTKVDDTREILDNVQYAPSRGRYKVYLIDEVHMLSRSSFNALLKTLEEPPEHVKFILATTDPQKLPVTVLSRCLQFHLKALTTRQIEQQLETILEAEQVTFESTALNLLAKAARGSMRDSLSLTDQAIAQGQGNINVSNVQQMLGGVDHNWPFKILLFIIKQDNQSLMALVQEIASYAPSYPRLLADLIQLLHQIALVQVVERHFDLSPEQASLLIKFAKVMNPEDVQLYYQIVLNGRKDLPYAADEQAAFDMVVLRLLAFKPMVEADVIHNNNNVAANAVELDISLEDIPASNVNHNVEVTAAEIADTINEDKKRVETIEKDVSILVEKVASSALNEHGKVEAKLDNQEASAEQELFVEQTVLEPRSSSDDPSVAGPSILYNEASIAETPIENDLFTDPQQLNNQIREELSEAQQPPKTVIQNKSIEQDNNENKTGVDAILADRNMLRSRRKAQENKSKKSNGANVRHNQEQQKKTEKEPAKNTKSTIALPDVESIPQEHFNPKIIDPAQVRHANQVDRWAHMIDSMALGGRIRQLAIHATVDINSTDDSLFLNLDQATKHLVSENAHQQLEEKLTELLARKITVELNIVDETEANPYKIQSHINDKRYQYAKELLAQDDIVQALQQDYQATLDEESIEAL